MQTVRRKLTMAALALTVAVTAAACTAMPVTPVTSTVPSVDINRYIGTWYEVASVKQFFSVGLVNTKAVYSLLPNGAGVLVNNSGNYFTADGLPSEIFGTAVPVDSSNARLNVSFTGSNGSEGLGNYWIVDLDADYQWAIVSDPTGNSCFILSRTKFITPELKADLLARAAAKGVNIGNVTDTPQF
jgi:lipocalin